VTATILAILLTLKVISLQYAVSDMATTAGVEPRLALCIVSNESQFEVMHRGDLDERGLWQLLPSTALWVAGEMGWAGFELDWLDDPVKNTEMGIWVLVHYPTWFSTRYLCQGD
jgi:soluble lytic murein transglycosylase-like protein